MARAINDIKSSIGNFYIGLPIVQLVYGLSSADVELGFDGLFSVVSIENLLFYTIAYAFYTFELILDAFRTEIQTKVDSSYIANDNWWHNTLMEFQKGDDLVLNQKTFVWGYATIDTTKQIIKRVAVRQKVDTVDNVYKVFLYVATEVNNVITPVLDDDKPLLEGYIFRKKYSGVLTKLITGTGDVVDLGLTINYNPLLLTSTGLSITDGVYPVNVAISDFISNLNSNNFGGKLNVTKLTD